MRGEGGPILVDMSPMGAWLDDPRVVSFYEQAERRPDIVAFHAMTTALAAPAAGASVLEVGCSVGATAVGLGRLVGPMGTVIGIDEAAPLIAAAERSAEGPVRFEVGSESRFDFPDDEFDLVRAYWARRGPEDPVGTVRELVRVCRPGGRVVLVDADAGSMSVDGLDSRLVGTVLGAAETVRSRAQLGARSGFSLRRRLMGTGCVDAVASPYVFTMDSLEDAAGFIPEFDEALPSRLPVSVNGHRAEWFRALERADESGELHVSLTGWAAAGRKPEVPRR